MSRIFVTEEGREPFSEWLTSLREQSSAKDPRRLDLSLGNLGDSHGLGEVYKNCALIMATGYLSPVLLLVVETRAHRPSIEKAKRYWNEYRRRSKKSKA